MASLVSRSLMQQRAARANQLTYNACRSFTSTSPWSAGHNRWSKIKHDKAKEDKLKSKERQLMNKEISTAIHLWGPDPEYNPRLTLALSNAKRAGIPKNVIEAALARGKGISLTGEALEQVTVEAILPHNVAVVIECQTDSKARLLQDVRHTIKNAGGAATPTIYLFEKKGRIVFEKKDGVDPDDYLDQAIEAGATDITSDDEGRLIVFTDPTETKSVGESLSKAIGLSVEELEIFWDPNKDTMVDITDEEAVRQIETVMGKLREEPCVNDIYMNTRQAF
ncbi:YebC-like protein [Aspergillus japonicus CBS 114.51]|uniref:YebC-like protein n=2 Tax=Aspergillus TaxID=5052 RepID=A0A2V5I266_ASPV1|nr:YebC-like protein [Aspergillus japonicus CBS 114.51]PYI22600.1 YebC-like protein [Aspergillus violaceofuscus CBS 115571]RAH77570.1 YebC-like protein [Aspergillus japonicus CBS 114.51]